jgi:poly(3-hydroxybutyrate) depolymerase
MNFVAMKVLKNGIYLLFIICSLSCCCFARVIGDGAGDFVFEYKIADQVKKIPVYYFAPKELTPMSRIVFVLHGDNRDGRSYRDDWQKYASRNDFIVLCPEFSKAEFPPGKYQCGNIYDYENKKYTERKDWTFNVIEGLFDFVKQDRKMKVEAYCIFGHSAGAQFVHRMVLFMPEARFSLAIANGAGNYTEPVFDKVPYEGLKGTCVTEESLKKSFAKEMVILMGEKDLMSKTMPKEGQFHEYDRVWKAKRFYVIAKAQAIKRQTAFKWLFKFVPNADHNSPLHAVHGSMLAARSKKFFTNPNIKEPNEIADGNKSGLTDSNMPSNAK